MASNMTHTELADWRRFCDGVEQGDHPAMFSAHAINGVSPHPRDAAVLYALRDQVYHAVTKAAALCESRTALALDLPSAYWLRPQAMAGAMLFGVRICLSDDVAWPALRVELPRG